MPTPPKDKHSEKKKNEIPLPPQPVPVAVQTVNGGTVQVPLRIYGRQEQETGYIIRKEPTLGKIVDLRPIGPEVWMLTYQHNPAASGETTQQDRILFAAQNKKGTSAAVDIVITILDNPPELSVPGSVELGAIALGGSASRIVAVSNVGGGVLEGAVVADPPWSVEPSAFKLRRGEKAMLRLTLVPDAVREYGGYLHFLGETKLKFPLHATAFAPFAAEPATVELTGTAERSGNITLSNHSDAELTVRVEANPRLHLPAQVVLVPKKSQTVSATLAADDPWGVDDNVRISLGSFVREVKVHVESTGPRLQVEQTTLEFEKVESGTSKSLAVKLVNRGGSRANVEVQIQAPFHANATRLAVDAGKSAELLVTLDATTSGPLSGSLKLTGTGAFAEIGLRAEVLPRKDTPSIRIRQTGSPAPVSPTASLPETAPEVDPADLNAVISHVTGLAQNLPGIRGIEIKRITYGTAEIAWTPPKASGELGYRVEIGRLSMDANGKLKQNWIPMPGVQFAKIPNRVTGLLTGIPLGIDVTARILALNPQGEPCAASLPVHFYVPAPKPFFTRRNTLLVGFALVLLIGVVVHRHQNGQKS